MGALLMCAGGCANHLRNIDTVNQETERTILNTKYDLKITPETIRDASYHVEIHKLDSVEIKKFDVRTVRELATPYKWWREFYEVPCGLLLFPVSVASHAFFLCTIGIFPYSIPQSINELAFTGMNPALNWESESRTEEFIIGLERKMVLHATENEKTPVGNTKIAVRSGDLQKTYTTDAFGGFDLNFISLNGKESFFPRARKISFSLASDRKKELKGLVLTRAFLSKLRWARTKINAYKMGPSGQKLFDTVIYLEKNGFEVLAYMLEESELARMGKVTKFQKDFKAAADAQQ